MDGDERMSTENALFSVLIRTGDDAVVIAEACLPSHPINLDNIKDRELIAAMVNLWAAQGGRA